MTLEEVKAKSIEEYFGTLQQSTIEAWREHLKTNKYSSHMALDDFYKEMPELVDTLIEDYMGTHDKLEEYKNNFTESDLDAIEYLKLLREFTVQGREDFLEDEDTELSSDIDAILSMIDSTLYKLEKLHESRQTIGLVQFLQESIED